MGTDAAEVVQSLPSACAIKIHRSLCAEVRKLLNRILSIFPEIEKARPRCSSGLEALCLLNNGIEKAKSLLQCCSESSKLYMALTSDVVLSRCQKSISLLEQSLIIIQKDVHVILAAEIAQIISDLRVATFGLDASDIEAGKALKSILQQYASLENLKEESVLESLRFATLRLNITSLRALVVEKRSIKKLLDKMGESELRKKQILSLYLTLLKKYGNLIVKGQTDDISARSEDFFRFASLCDQSSNKEHRREYGSDETQIDMVMKPVPPKEFRCPISGRLMHDPVVIASGQTFERMWIQNWLGEGHNVCPKTGKKLTHLSLIPNSVMKDLISKWCMNHEVTVPDPHLLSAPNESCEISSTSIASLGSSMNNMNLPVDYSSVSIGSLDFSHNSDSSSLTGIGNDCMSTKASDKGATDGSTCKNQSCVNESKIKIEFLVNFNDLPWDSRCQMVDDVNSDLKLQDQDCQVSCMSFVEDSIKFLNDARELHDVKALRAGCLLLLALARKCRESVSFFQDSAYDLLGSLLDSEVSMEVLAIWKLLSHNKLCRSYCAAPVVLSSWVRILDTQIRQLQEPAVVILHNLSSHSDIRRLLVSLKLIPKLVPLLEDSVLARYSVVILKNLCDYEDVKVAMAETNGCITSICNLLEAGNGEDQEHALTILLSLCSQSICYCDLVMGEGIIPALVNLSNNGNEKAKASAMELLRLLREVEFDDAQKCVAASDIIVSRDCSNDTERKSSSKKAHGILGKIFSKSNSHAPRKRK